jgi:hypothetical protein
VTLLHDRIGKMSSSLAYFFPSLRMLSCTLLTTLAKLNKTRFCVSHFNAMHLSLHCQNGEFLSIFCTGDGLDTVHNGKKKFCDYEPLHKLFGESYTIILPALSLSLHMSPTTVIELGFFFFFQAYSGGSCQLFTNGDMTHQKWHPSSQTGNLVQQRLVCNL